MRKREAAATNEKKEKAPKEGGRPKNEARPPFGGRYNPKLHKRAAAAAADSASANSGLSHQAWSKIVTVGAVGIIVYASMRNQAAGGAKETPLAKRDEFLGGKRSQASPCAPAYKKEIEDLDNRACLPSRCGRAVADGLVTDGEAHDLLKLAKRALAKTGGSGGGASIVDLHSGALSDGDKFVDVYKSHPGLYAPDDFDTYRLVMERVKAAVADHFSVDGSSLHLTHPTFFSRLEAQPASTAHDEYWHVHVDKDAYPSFHYTSLLYLTDYGDDFRGGQFVFVDNHDKLNRTIEPRLGRVSFFTSGLENRHYVKPVTSGARYALTMGFTCDKAKSIPDPGSRL